MLVEEYLDKIIKQCQQAKIHLENGNKRLVVGKIDEIEFSSEAAKWILINEIIEEEGKF